MRTIGFGRGGGMAKAAPVAKGAAPGAGSSAWSGFNGVIGGKRGFQPGNPGGKGRPKGYKVTGAKKPRSSVSKASTAHRSARTAVAKHIKAGTALTPAGRTAIKTAAAASRTLQTAHADAAALRSAQGKATRAVASGRASALPKPGEKPTSAPAPAPKPSNAKAVKAGAKEASDTKVARATTHLGDLHAGVKAGALKPTDIHAHVDRIARGTTKAELFSAAKAHGIEHGATTKKALVSHLKDHASGLSKPGPAKVEAPKAKAQPVAAKPSAEPGKTRGSVADRAKAATARAEGRVRTAEVAKRALIHDDKGGLNTRITPGEVKQSQRHDRTIQRTSGRIDQLHQARRDLENAARKKAKGAKP